MRKLILALVFGLLTLPVFAADGWYVTGHYEYPFASMNEACTAGVQTKYGLVPSSYTFRWPVDVTSTSATCQWLGDGNLYNTGAIEKYVCTDPAVIVNGVCSTPTTTTTTTTTTRACPPAGETRWPGTETNATFLNLNTCIDSCAYKASGMIKTSSRVILFGPFQSEGRTCNASDPGYSDDNDPGNRCSYRNAAGKCEAACRTGQEYKQVPTGAYACVAVNNTTPTTEPKDTTCPRGYLNISTDPSSPNCAPTGGLGQTNPSGPANCPAGQHSTSMGPNGASYCVYDTNDNNPATKTTNESTTTKNNADGTTSQVTTISFGNSDGSTTTKTTEVKTNTDGSKTTSESVVTTKNKLGQEGVSDGGDDAKNDFCKRNPGLTICRNSTVAGTGSATTCTGDAIQCETLRRMSAWMDPADTAESTLGKSILSVNDPMKGQITSVLAGNTVDLSSQSLDQSGFVGGGSCFANRTITVMGRSIEVSFTSVCNNILPLRFAIVACSLIVAYLLVSKSILYTT